MSVRLCFHVNPGKEAVFVVCVQPRQLFQIRGSRSKALHDKALVNCQYSMATFSTGERKRRPRGDRKSQEMTMHLRQAFQAAIRVEVYPRSQIDIFVEVCFHQNILKLLSNMLEHV